MEQTMKILTRALLLLAVAFGGATAQAPAAPAGPAPTLKVAVFNETAAAEKAKGTDRRDDAVRPGDVLRYTLTFTNETNRPLSQVHVSNPLPAGLVLVGETARINRSDAEAEFSADGGKTFSTKPMETVMVNGTSVTREVPAARYTNVRWIIRGSVAPKGVVTAHYNARVGGSAASTSPSSAPASSGR
jgi:uncharacterized repeat protein (TIGR01451 family)